MFTKKFLEDETSIIAIDIETTGLSRTDEIVTAAVAFCSKPYKKPVVMSFYLYRYAVDEKDRVKKDDRKFEKLLKATLFNLQFKGRVIFHNLSFDLKFLLIRYRYVEIFRAHDFCKLSDTLAASRDFVNNKYVNHIDATGLKCHSLKYLGNEYLKNFARRNSIGTFDDATNGIHIIFADVRKVLDYNEDDALATLKLYLKFKELFSVSEWEYFEKIESEHCLNIFHLMWHGVYFDKTRAWNLSDKLSTELGKIEKFIHMEAGRAVNLSSLQDIAKAIFYNPRLTYRSKSSGLVERIKPLYITDNDQPKVDLDTLKTLYFNLRKSDSNSRALPVIASIMRHIEISKTLMLTEVLLAFAVKTAKGHKLFPNISAAAVSGRITCSKPALLGLPKKVLKKSLLEGLDAVEQFNDLFKDENIRSTITHPEGHKFISNDITGLDLVVVTHYAIEVSGNTDFHWRKFIEPQFGEYIDSHFALMQEFQPGLYEECFEFASRAGIPIFDYWAKKPSLEGDRNGIVFVSKKNGVKVRVNFTDDSKKTLENMREMSKRMNLASTYLMSAGSLAVKLSEALQRIVSVVEAQQILDKFYKAFPEIRQFQDRVANEVYFNGYKKSIYGNYFKADVWYDLNRNFIMPSGDQLPYELILFIKGEYWYLKAKCWVKETEDVIKDLRYLDKKFGMCFQKIEVFHKLNHKPFKKKRELKPKSKFNRKTEDSVDEDSDFIFGRIPMTHFIDNDLGFGTTLTSEGEDILSSFIEESGYVIPEKAIGFYRIEFGDPSSKYFKKYKPLLKVAKKFFPNFCQGVAATVAKKCLTHARKLIEMNTTTAVIRFFIHDQIVSTCAPYEEHIVCDSLQEAVQLDMRPLMFNFSGEIKTGDSFDL